MQEIKTEIEINAEPEKVWATLMDMEKWSEWSPIIKAVSGTPEVGQSLDITMAGKEGKDGPKYKAVVMESAVAKSFRWRAKMMAEFMFTNDKIFELEKTENGTRLIHKEWFKGIMVPIFCGKMEEGVPPMLNSMNEALKKRVEAN